MKQKRTLKMKKEVNVILMVKKTAHRKARLVRAQARNRRMPVFVIAKTNRRIASNREKRDWRRQKLKSTEKE